MSARRVMRYTVVVRHPETDVATAVLAGKPVPSWAEDLVHNDDLVYAEDLEVEVEGDDEDDEGQAPTVEVPPAVDDDGSSNGPVVPEPPRAGPGSGVEAWSVYATGLGIEVPADAKRDDVIELVDQHSALAQG